MEAIKKEGSNIAVGDNYFLGPKLLAVNLAFV